VFAATSGRTGYREAALIFLTSVEMLFLYGTVVSADGRESHSTMVLPDLSITPKSAQVPHLWQIFIYELRPKHYKTVGPQDRFSDCCAFAQ
jgi:hypothetical protein